MYGFEWTNPFGTKKRPPASGLYTEGGYTYEYDATTLGIVIVATPRGTKRVVVPKGTLAWNAVWTKIVSGAAKPTSRSTGAGAGRAIYAAMQNMTAQTPAPRPASTPSGYQPSTAADLMAAAASPVSGSVKAERPPWFWPAVTLGGVVVLGGLALALTSGSSRSRA